LQITIKKKGTEMAIKSRKDGIVFGIGMIFVIYLVLVVPISGCSVGMALSGKKDPNLGVIRKGATRGEVELQLGHPISSITTEDGRRLDTYEYEIGNEPSAGRAVAHGIMDVLTLGIWEVVGTPVEAVQGKKYQLAITYDSDNRVIGINQPLASLPSASKDDPASQGVKNLEEKLDYIKRLKDSDKITEEEYNKMRRDILIEASR
jgi:hypothetical protein